MEFKRISLEDHDAITDTVVVIDVIRAFTTAAYAFAAGATEIMLVDSVEEAFALHTKLPSSLLMGSKHGLPVAGFHFGNSPSALLGVDLTGCSLIQRTTWGTKGVIFCGKAQRILASSFCCAKATAQYLVGLSPKAVTFMLTGVSTSGRGEEDRACADYIEALISNEVLSQDSYVERVMNSRTARYFLDPSRAKFPVMDLHCCSMVDLFDFAMAVTRYNDQFVMKAIQSSKTLA